MRIVAAIIITKIDLLVCYVLDGLEVLRLVRIHDDDSLLLLLVFAIGIVIAVMLLGPVVLNLDLAKLLVQHVTSSFLLELLLLGLLLGIAINASNVFFALL